ncbi:MFS transporter [Nocardia vulneris]|uniref:MFS transporter n=1 Tax=Nocardia vulneris TaxID=1141657 RepID=UPI0030D0AA6F
MRPAVLSLMLVVFGLTTGEFVIAGILPEVSGGLAVSVPAAGMLVTAYAIGMIVGGPVVTMLTARVSRRRLVVGLVLFAICANLGSAFAPNYPVLLAMRAAAGLIVATFFAVAIATAVSTAEPGKEATAVARVALGLNLGIVLGTPIGALIGQNFGWRVTFVAVALCVGLALPVVLRYLPDAPGTAAESVFGELRVFGDRAVWAAIALTVLGNIGVVTVFTFITPLLTDFSGFGAGAVPVLLLVYGAGAVVGNQVGGWLADRTRAGVASLLAALAVVLLLFWALGDGRIAAVLLTFGLGALAFAIVPGMQTRVIAAAAAAPTLAVAVNASGFQLAAAGAGRLGGWVLGDGSGLRAIPLVGAVLTLAGLALALVLLWRDREQVGEPASELAEKR